MIYYYDFKTKRFLSYDFKETLYARRLIETVIEPISAKDNLGWGRGNTKQEMHAIRVASAALDPSFFKSSRENQERIVNDLISKLSKFT